AGSQQQAVGRPPGIARRHVARGATLDLERGPPTGGRLAGPGAAVSESVPTVAVVVVNYRGADDTIECVRALGDLDWPSEQLQVIVVDNASGDDSVARIRAAAPSATVIASDVNTGCAGGCTRGAAAAKSRYVAFVNNDARPDPGWLRAAIPVLERDLSIVCVASKVLDWEGNTVDFV